MLRVIEEEKLMEKARLQGNYLKERLLGLQKKYPLIGDVRGMGLMVGLELVIDLLNGGVDICTGISETI